MSAGRQAMTVNNTRGLTRETKLTILPHIQERDVVTKLLWPFRRIFFREKPQCVRRSQLFARSAFTCCANCNREWFAFDARQRRLLLWSPRSLTHSLTLEPAIINHIKFINILAHRVSLSMPGFGALTMRVLRSWGSRFWLVRALTKSSIALMGQNKKGRIEYK